MKLADIDWSVLRGALVMLVASLLASGALLGGSFYFWAGAEREHRNQNNQLMSVRGRYQTLDEEERIIEEYLPQYRELEARGVIGRERRLDWIEALRSVARELKLPSVRYNLDSQTRFEPEFPVTTGEFRIFVSPMRLDIGLLHEEDLLRLLRELDRRATGSYSVERCAVRRQGPNPGRSPTEANLTADCTLRWFTIRQPGAGEDAA